MKWIDSWGYSVGLYSGFKVNKIGSRLIYSGNLSRFILGESGTVYSGNLA